MASGTGVARTRPRKQVHPWRVVIVVGGLALVVSLFLVLGYNSDTSDRGRQAINSDIAQLSPAPGSIVAPQDDVEVHLRSGLTGVLILGTTRIPEDQLIIDNATSTITFRPGPGKIVSRLPAGVNNVAVFYWKQTGPEPARQNSSNTYGWSFRVAA